jgi:hypothetical protein
MSRILFAAARGARVQVLGKNISEHWWNTLDFGKMHSHTYRIHPEDAHLQYGPISTALREIAEDYSWNPSWEHYAAHAVEDRFTLLDRQHCETDYPLFYLFLAEFLADEGM